ncbi:polyphosphate polymerase domain-containing protein [Solibacillus daqui]|uniref:polyphosphate polymerase domain-containing protein n=1 Tax=Solibacillus daqui TaxID=2912187 RepID=UPI0023654463|nr:polyphosphate polymerase domain-containing protein [Solibacillus daqui]
MTKQTSYNPNGRSEMKFGITYVDYQILKMKMRYLMKLDPHSGANGRYSIRSCYFDNFDNKVMNEKKEGFINRDKYRVRIYNKSDEVIHLERKSKRNNQTFKSKCKLSKKEFERMRVNDFEWMKDDERSLIRDLYKDIQLYHLKPITVVDYEREAYLYEHGNVRVTFDCKVQTSMHSTDMFNKTLPMVDVLEQNEVILEVKFDEYLPTVIKMLLQGIHTRHEAYSKYQLSRMFG